MNHCCGQLDLESVLRIIEDCVNNVFDQMYMRVDLSVGLRWKQKGKFLPLKVEVEKAPQWVETAAHTVS